MKKIIGSLLIVSASLLANEFYAKIEPLETYTIKSSVNGKIIKAYESLEGKFVVKDSIIEIDNQLNTIDLKNTQEKLQTLKSILEIEEEILKSYEKVSSKSKYDKDNQKIKILNIISQISDLETKIATLQDTIANKKYELINQYLYKLNVKKGDYVNPGSTLFTAMDISSGKLTIYVPIDLIEEIKSKEIYIDSQKTNLKINKIYDVADEKHISSYKCEILIPKPQKFSTLVKIEFK